MKHCGALPIKEHMKRKASYTVTFNLLSCSNLSSISVHESSTLRYKPCRDRLCLLSVANFERHIRIIIMHILKPKRLQWHLRAFLAAFICLSANRAHHSNGLRRPCHISDSDLLRTKERINGCLVFTHHKQASCT